MDQADDVYFHFMEKETEALMSHLGEVKPGERGFRRRQPGLLTEGHGHSTQEFGYDGAVGAEPRSLQGYLPQRGLNESTTGQT